MFLCGKVLQLSCVIMEKKWSEVSDLRSAASHRHLTTKTDNDGKKLLVSIKT